MAEEIAAASVRIIPDFTTFDAAILAHATKAAKTIETTLAKVNVGAGLGGAAASSSRTLFDTTKTGLDGITKSSDKLGESVKKTSQSLPNLNTALGQTGRLLLPITLGFTAAAVKAVLFTSAIVEAVNAVKVAFGESAGEILAFARGLQTTESFFGLTERAALDAAATFGLFLNDIVKSEPVLANLSEQLIKASADVGSLFNIATDKVIKDFQSGLAGQTRAVRKYGIDISEATTKQEAFRLGLAQVGVELTEEDKRISRLSILLHSSAVAAGDAELTQNTFAGAVRNTNVAIGGAVDKLGQQLLPIAQKVVEVVGALADRFGNMSAVSQRLIIGFGLIAAAAGPVFLIVSKLVPIFTALVPAIQRFVVAIQAGTLALGPQIAILVGLAAAYAALRFAFDAPTKYEEAASQFDRLTKAALELNKATGDGTAAARDYKNAIDALGVGEVDLTNFDSIIKAVEAKNRELFEAERAPKDRKKGDSFIDTIADEIAGVTIDPALNFITQGILGRDPQKGIEDLNATAVAVNALRQAVQANEHPAAQALIASTKDVAVRRELEKAYEEEIRLQAERKVKQDAATASAEKAIQAAIDQLDPTEKLNRLFKEGIENLENLLTAQTAVVSAEKSLRSANAAAGKARERLNKLLRDGAVDANKVKASEDALTDAINRRVESEKEIIRIKEELAKLQLPATADELAEATDNITKAEIALAQAQRERAEAMKALEPRQVRALNLAGLSLDQLRTTLAVERATLATKRTQARADEDSPEEKAEKAVLAAIAEREAERDLTDARAELTEVQKKGSDSDEEVIAKREELTRATIASTKAEREELDARKKLAEVKAGDPDFEQKVAEARQAIADAGENAADAADRLRLANIALIEQEDILAGKVNAGNIALRDRLLVNKDLLAQQLKNEAFLKLFIEVLQRASPVFPHGPTPGGGNLFDSAAIARSLINDPNSPFREVFRKLGIPGYAMGAVLDRPTLGIFAEAGREALIPLTKPKRAATLLAGAFEFPAIENEIAKIRMSSSGVTAPTRTMGSGGAGFTLDRPATSETVAVLEDILKHLKSRPDIPVSVQAGPGMDEARLARKVQRELARYWGTP